MTTMISTLAAALEKQGYDTLTPVQEAVTNPDLEGQDLLVSAQTGSGKTVGFGLAIGPTILGENGQFGPAGRPLALCIAPTRELALQVKRELQWLYAGAGVTMASCVGGMDMRDERRALDRGAHIVVATPGRLKDHILRGSLDMSDIRAIVLDEADEMLDLGFREDLEYILGEAPETRRTLMFSATVPPMIVKLAKSYQNDAVRVTTATKESQHTDIEYLAMQVVNHDVDAAIVNCLRYYDTPNAIVFCNTRASVTRLTTRLSNRGFATVALSGELSQQERSNALQAMRDGRARVCVATDVAARGIDLPNLELVIHAELPTNAETLLHRSGRTGRAGRKGVSALIAPSKMRRRAENLLKWGKLSAKWTVPPTAEEITSKDQERLLNDPVWSEEVSEEDAAFATKLLERYAPEKIAAAYLRLFAGKNSAPEHLSEYKDSPQREERKPRERQPFGPSKWFSLDIGREDKAEARWLLPMICKAGGITKSEIGAIRIQPNETYVEISEPAVAGFLKSIGPDMSLENQAKLKPLDGPPQLGERGPRKTKRDYEETPRPKRDLDETPRKPRDRSAPPRQDDQAKVVSGAGDDPRSNKGARKPHQPKPARKDHGDALVPAKPHRAGDNDKPFKGKPKSGGKPPYKGKGEDKPRNGRGRDKPPFKGKDGGKPGFKDKAGGKPGPKGKDAKSAKPRASASDTSKRFTPPGGKPKARNSKKT